MAGPGGIVYLVGAGPGSSGLITVEGVRCLGRADLVVYDALVNPLLLDHAPTRAERICVRTHGVGTRLQQSEIHALLIERARRGCSVVRLKNGDPFLLGGGGEEAAALAAAGIPFEVVPGVSAALAVPAYAGIPLTHPGMASSVTILNGYASRDEGEPAVQWDVLARIGGTLVFLMPLRQLRSNMARLAEHGLPGDTPVAVIQWGTVAEQESVEGTVATIADEVEARRLGRPAVAIVGQVVRLRKTSSWAERKPLFGRRVVVTRPRAQAADFIDRLTTAGADVVPCPSIEIVPPSSFEALDAAINRIEEYDWLVFTSTNGVEIFFTRLATLGRDVRALHRARLAAVGPQTARALENRGLMVDVVPAEFRAEGVAEEMRRAGVAGARVLLPRAAGAREILPVMLREAEACVEEVASYDTALPRGGGDAVRHLLEAGAVDLVTFTSSSTVRNFLALLGENAVELLRRARIGCIGPITADTARAAGLTVDIQPSAYTVAALAEEIVNYFADAPRRSAV